MADRNRYNRREPLSGPNPRDDRNWRDQEEQFSSDRRGRQPDYEEGYGYQMSEPYAGTTSASARTNTRPAGIATARYGQGGTGYSRQSREYASEGEYSYGPARYETAPGWRGSSFTMKTRAAATSTRGPARTMARMATTALRATPVTAASARSGAGGLTARPADTRGRRAERGSWQCRNGRDWWDRASDEVMSWFGDEDAARRRRADHRGRGPSNYTRSDDRIREDVNDNLTDDWGVDARNVTVGRQQRRGDARRHRRHPAAVNAARRTARRKSRA